ncbi:hypothetical protein GCM10027034_34510 [Ramlibacter solisilvae]|uniref:PKD domain-containing protein n=1 Tax=Ramlibacter tataouinensis TaxID=94132 RepID=A0A127JSI8_9BURK|nr:PKD domain-containing protein [Ramlibacter tataouinensis]AMO22936.1 hypothetical protein UC35_08620 [Ramlibacter tataouinensis]
MMKRLVFWIGSLLLLALAGCGGSDGGTPAVATSVTPNALFQVGAAVVDISPSQPVFAGGYGDKNKPAIQVSNDPLQVRAFVVAKGDKAVAFAVVDSTGWFGEYQDAEAGYGQFGARVNAAKALEARGFKADRSAVMVSTTHSHATPTVVGIWGLMGPENRAYVKAVHDAVVRAVDQAAANLKTSELWTVNGDLNTMIWQNGQGTNHPDGFPVDPRMPVLWARDPATGATNSLYVSIPTHPDQFRPFNGTVVQGFSADVPGYVRKQMDDTFAGTAVVGTGTLGRQEPPGQNPDYAEVGFQGEFVVNALRLAMAKATPLKSDALGSAEVLKNVTVGPSAGNQGLLALMKYNAAGAGLGGPNCNAALGGNCSIPRSLTAPWCNGNCSTTGTGSTTLGTYITALRIGPQMWVSNPGESFPEVNDAIRAAMVDVESVNVVGLAGDFLGYNWNLNDYSTAQIGSSDFLKYNVGPDLAQSIADAGYDNAVALGFKVKPAKVAVKAVADTSVASLPGVQFYPTRLATSGPATISFYGSTGQPQDNWKLPNHVLSAISWDFGDGTPLVSSASQERLAHAFTTPGSYKVTASVTDNTTGKSRAWSQTLTIHWPLSLEILVLEDTPSRIRLGLRPAGGTNTLLAAHWTCPGGDKPSGLTVTCAKGAGPVSVKAWDGAGSMATAQRTLN